MKSIELTNEVVSVSDQRDVVISAIEQAIRDTWAVASKGGLLGKPSPEKIGKKFSEEFPVYLKKSLESSVSAIKRVMFQDSGKHFNAGVNAQTQNLVIGWNLVRTITDSVEWCLNNNIADPEQIISRISQSIDRLAEILVHEIVHLEQQARQPGYAAGSNQKDYRSYLAKSMDQFIAAVNSMASKEDSDIYHASPQEIPAYAHQMVYRLISQALGGKKLTDIPQDEIPYAIQEMKDALKDIAAGMSAKDETLARYLGFKDGDERRVKVYKRFMKSVYGEVQAYIGKMQEQMTGQLTESFDTAVDYEWHGHRAIFTIGDLEYDYSYAYDQDGKILQIAFSQDGNASITGTGNAQAVFATVIAITRELMSKLEVDMVAFSAAEANRQKLYVRLAKTLLPRWKVEKDDDTGYIFVIKPQEVTETFDSPIKAKWQEMHPHEGYAKFTVGDVGFMYAYDTKPEEDDIPREIWIGFEDDNRGMGITGTGNAQQVFATVVDLTRQVLAKFPTITTLTFSSEEPSRTKLYQRIVKTLLPDWTLTRKGKTFRVSRQNQEVTETLNQPYEWQEQESYNEDVVYKFQTEDDTFYEVTFVGKGSGRYIIEFSARDSNYNIRFGITGSGDAFRVFATVGDILKQFVSKYKPTLLTFSAAEKSRIKLYDRLAKLIQGLGFEQQQTIGGRGYYAFKADKPNEVTESFDNPYEFKKDSRFGRVTYEWTTEDGRECVCHIRLQDSDENNWGLMFTVGGEIKQTGTGDAPRIFATVIACFRDWLSNEGRDANGIAFAGDMSEPSRIKLYDRFARMMPRFGFRDIKSNFQTNTSKFYEFERIKPLNEKNYPGQETPGMRSKAHRKMNRTSAYARTMLKPGRRSDEFRSTMITPSQPGQQLKRDIQIDRKRRKEMPDTRMSSGVATPFTLDAAIQGSANALKTMKKMNKKAYGDNRNKVQVKPLDETFNKPLAWQKKIHSWGLGYLFRTPAGKRCGVDIAINGAGVADIVFDVNGKMEITGGGEAITIFATVIDCVKNALGDPAMDRAWKIEFGAAQEDTSRQKLYSRFAKILPQAGYEFVGTHDTNRYKVFEFVNPEKEKEFRPRKQPLTPPSEQIEETFNAPVDYNWISMGNDVGRANFTVGDVTYLFVYNSLMKTREGSPLWVNIMFNDTAAKAKGKGFGVTGSGNAAQVFATAVQLIRDVLEKFPSITKIKFTAKEKSRSDLYARMVSRLLPDWEMNTKKESGVLAFTVSKPLNESTSAGGTCSGGIATVSQPLGGMVRRPGSSILAGINTSEATPNTPPWMLAYKKKNQNKKRSK